MAQTWSNNYSFRILIQTETGTQVSYMGGDNSTPSNTVGAKFADSNNSSLSPANIVTRINRMVKCTFLDQKNVTIGEFGDSEDVNNLYDNNADNRFDGANNPWLQAVAGDDNRIGFVHTDTTDTNDPFAKVKFYGTKVCTVLGLQEGVWIHAAGFNLSVQDGIESSIRGSIVATSLAIQGSTAFGDGSRFTGEMIFDISGSETKTAGVGFVTGDEYIGKLEYDPFSSGSLVEVDLVRSKGDVIALYTSDERLKDDIQYILDPVSKVKQLNGVEFTWNSSQSYHEVGKKDIGIIAQDLQKVYPELVESSSNGYLGVKYERLVGLLIEAVKEQSKEIQDLQTRMKLLENK